MSTPYFEKISYADRLPKYRDFTEYEWDFKNSFSYDDYFGFSDLKIYHFQNNYRYNYMWDDLGITPDSASFCNAFNEDRERHRLVQRHLCDKLCFWNPQNCFFQDSHSGNLTDLMSKKFHDHFNPAFQEEFNRDFHQKIDWAPTGGLGHFPSIGLNKLIEDLGITTKLNYNIGQYAVNFENLNKKFWNSIPVRPLYVIEEKKCHDILEALINVRRIDIDNNRKQMKMEFDQSYKGNGPIRKPILSMMMWGPLTDFNIKKTDEKCKFDSFRDRQAGTHVCTNFSGKNYWMYSHSEKVECVKGPIEHIEGPVMTHDLTVIYPCNRSGCNHNCLCDLCLNSQNCSKSEHKNHMTEIKEECVVEQNFQCQDHNINHPDNFDVMEDIMVQKNIFYHNLELEKQPRRHSAGDLKFAGIKRDCGLCRHNVENHFRHHKVIHLNCRFCLHQMKTSIDKDFWDKVCKICGKTFTNIKSLKFWHTRTHNADWKCNECDIDFTRRWTLKRHLMEIHNIKKEEFDLDNDSDESDSTEIDDEYDTLSSHNDNDSSNSDEDGFECQFCQKEFSAQRYLDVHMKVMHTRKEIFRCNICGESFTLKEHLKRHIETVHIKGKKYTCTTCGTNFNRIDNLNEHIQRVHSHDVEKFSCQYCDRKFSRKFSMSRHEKICAANPDSNKK